MIQRILLFILTFAFISVSQAKEIRTNGVNMMNSPKWLKRTRVDKVVDRVQTYLEWTVRRINVYWYENEADFGKVHNLGPLAVAVTIKGQDVVHLGRRVKNDNFDQVFAHELVHIIFSQKYQGAIPQWLEEGLASYLSKKGKVDYKWLAKKPFPPDVRQLTHPFKGSADSTRYHYLASQALTEMIASKCDLTNLLRLSVQRKLNDYLSTYCEIKDLNADFQKWIKRKSA